MNIFRRGVDSLLATAGVRLVRNSPSYDHRDIGRNFQDDIPAMAARLSGAAARRRGPYFFLRPGTPRPDAPEPTVFDVINQDNNLLQAEVLYSHLTLLKLLKHFQFQSVLDIGSHMQSASRIFRHVGKSVTTIEVAPGYAAADYNTDYLVTRFPERFDAIWCSQTLEHQRNVGRFLDKIFDDLKDGGLAAITVPLSMGPVLEFGHCNRFTPLTLIYNLVLAGFDCSQASVKCYNWNVGIIVQKRYNGIRRHSSFALLPATAANMQWSAVVGDEISPELASSFPFPVTNNVLRWDGTSIHWGDPI